MKNSLLHVKKAIEAFKNGHMVIVTDDECRENEGDLIIPAECITDKHMSIMIRHGSGIVCLASNASMLKKMDLPLMVPQQENTSERGTPFTISVDAKHNITTGVSATDRVATIKCMIADDVKPSDLAKPGHIFPLQASEGGVLERDGHTEGSVDLAIIAGYKPAAVLCELMNDDGTMMRGETLISFAKNNNIHMLSINDIINYRLYHDDFITDTVTSTMPTHEYGTITLRAYRESLTNKEHLALFKEPHTKDTPILVRIHSSCTTGDIFHSIRCDCHEQLHYSLKLIQEQGGILIYLDQEGRGIGLFNKIKAYALQDQGLDTVDANLSLGFEADARNYVIAANILKKHQINNIRLLTNNPKKLQELNNLGLKVTRVEMPAFTHRENLEYINTKKTKLFHDLTIEDAI